jgi:dipeptidyl-peptidase-3
MVDAVAFRDGVGRLLAEVQRIKSTGDYGAAMKLFDAYGIHFDPALRDEVLKRVEALDLPTYIGFVMPKLTPVTGPDGAITDVTISYPMDLTAQMLEWSGATARAAPRRPAPTAPNQAGRGARPTAPAQAGRGARSTAR